MQISLGQPLFVLLIQTYIYSVRYYLTPTGIATIKKPGRNKCWPGCGETAVFVPFWWECKWCSCCGKGHRFAVGAGRRGKWEKCLMEIEFHFQVMEMFGTK